MNAFREAVNEFQTNYYGSLCTELYEILHEKAPQDELEFYMSYAEKGKKILEPLCGSGRFFVPFIERGFDICGIDLSGEMLKKLREKAPDAKAVQGEFLTYHTEERFDYIFISSGSVSLFTDGRLCRRALVKLKELLAAGGKLVFAVDTVAERCKDDSEYRVSASVKTKEGFDLRLKTKNSYDEKTQTQYSPGIYELYKEGALLQRETMDFQTHLYKFGELEPCLSEIGFTEIKTYSSFSKIIAKDAQSGMFLFECSVR